MASVKLLGETFGFVRAGLMANSAKNIKIKMTDSLGTTFTNSKMFKTNEEGVLKIDPQEFQDMITTAKAKMPAAFILNEFKKFKINISSDDEAISDKIIVDSGVGTHICKEEWRGDIVGNLFYPAGKTDKNKAIIHINGNVPLLQDGRATMLAREGYTVLEIGYNLPQYGQEDFYLRRAPFDLMYFRKAIEKLLDHHTVYGQKVAVVGHSKGAEFGVALASLMPELVEVSVTSSQFMTNPAALPVTYKGRVFDAIPFHFQKLIPDGFNPKKDVLKIKNQCEVYSWKNEMLFNQDANGEWGFNEWVVKDTKADGFPTENANKIVHCQTVSDPLHSPSEEISKAVTDMSLEGVNADITYAKAGHLPLIPTIPMISSSFTILPYKNGVFKSIIDYSRNRTDEQKIMEQRECQKMYDNVTMSLNKYF
jgi:hypothetical protein